MTAVYIFLGIVGGAFIAFLFLRSKKPEKTDTTAFQMLLQQMNELTRTVDQKLGDSHKEVSETIRYQ